MSGPVGGHASVQAGRSLSYQATPAGPARPTGGKTLESHTNGGHRYREPTRPAPPNHDTEPLWAGTRWVGNGPVTAWVDDVMGWSSPRGPDTPTMGDESLGGESDWEKSRRNDVRDASSRMSSNVTRWRSCGCRVSRSRRWPASWGSTTPRWGTESTRIRSTGVNARV